MIVRKFWKGSRWGRIFFGAERFVNADAFIQAGSDYENGDDRARESRLRFFFELDSQNIDVHSGLDPECARTVFVRIGVDRVFACVIVPESWVAETLRLTQFVHETFSFQVGQGDRLNRESVLTSFEAWRDRNFPDLYAHEVSVTEVEGG